MLQIEGGKGAAEFLDGILYLRWNDGVVIGEDDAVAAVAAMSKLGNGGKHPLLIHMGAPAWIGGNAQEILAAAPPVTRVALFGSSPVDMMVAHFFMSRHRPPCPARYFTSAEEALAWLNDHPEKLPASGSACPHRAAQHDPDSPAGSSA